MSLPRCRPLLLLLGLLLGLVAIASPASADPPMFLEDRITDTAGVLDTGQVEEAIAEVESETPLDLFVVYMDSFDGMATTEWISQTAAESNLGSNDVLLAVAVEDRAYDVGMQGSAELSESDVSQVLGSEVEPALANNDWTGAAVAMAEGLQDAYGGLGGAGGGNGGDGGGSGFGLGTIFLLGLVVILGIGVFSVFRSSRSEQPKRQPDGRRLPPGHPLNLPTEELEKRAGAALVGADDAVRSSEEELAFAKAQFGLQATDEFTEVLEQAKQKVGRAFAVRQQLDDDVPETEPQRRQMLADIIILTQEADEALDAQAERFAQLRNMQARAPEVLDELEQRAAEVARQVEGARSTLARLANQYPAEALASISRNPDQARSLLTAAREAVAEGRAEVDGGDRAAAVTQAHVAEEAIGQAVTLLKAVDGAGKQLAEADERLDAAIASITADVQDANRLAKNDPVVVARRKEAEAAIAQGHQARDGGDPLAALKRLAAAESAIDAALAPARETEENNRRAAAHLNERLGRLHSQIQSVSDFISTRRGRVGSEARTRLSEAARLAKEAGDLARTDPQGALAKVGQAEAMAASAQQLAERDANQYDDFGGFGGGFGGGRRGGVDVGSLVLGGILLGGLGGGGGHRGGWGGSGGGFGGGMGGGFGGGMGGGFGGGGGGFGGGMGGRF